MLKILAVFIYCLAISTSIEVSVAATSADALFTAEEQQWIKDHPVIRVGGEMDWAPFDYVNQYGDYDGLVNEFLQLIEKKSGLKLVVETGYTGDELVTRFKNNHYDLLPATYYSQARTEYGIYTEPYLKLKEFVYIRDDNKAINSFYDLADKTIAMPKGYTIIREIKEILPDVTILETNNILGAINAVLNKQADAMIEGQAVMSYALKQNMITGLRGIAQEAFEPKNLHILVRKEAPILQQIIQKSLNAITWEERKVIVDKYMAFTGKTANERKLKLTADEYHYLKKKKVIKMCVDPDWLPFERINEQGVHEGMAANYMQLFSSWIGIPIQLVITDNWQQSLQFGKARRCDILSAAAKTPERENFWSFTSPYIDFPNVIATLNKQNFIKDIKEVLDKPLGVVKGFATFEILRNKYPGIHLIEVNSVSDGLNKVSTGELFGFIDTIAVIGYTIHKENFLHLKIAGEVGAELKLAIAVRKDEQQLLTVLNKAISHLTREDKNEVDSQWISITFDTEFDYTLLWQVLAVALLIILIIMFWVRKLSLAKSKIEQLNVELEESKKIMIDSINYSSLIQRAIVPDFEDFSHYFDEYFTIWQPRDVVGGDIYFIEQLRHKDECLLMVIDCTGHGVPGAFVTMLVKAVERQIVNDIMLSDEQVSPAKVLSIFNKSIKNLLRQGDDGTISNVGFDGGILYINYQENILRYAGAETALFIVQDDKISRLKGDRHSIAYKSSDINYQFNDHTILIKNDMYLYLTTDGYLDQNGGEKGFRFGRKRFMKLVEENHKKSFADQKELLLSEIQKYRGNETKNDDVTVLGFKLRKVKESIKEHTADFYDI